MRRSVRHVAVVTILSGLSVTGIRPISGQETCGSSFVLEETARFGSVGGEDALSRVWDLDVSPDGEIYVVQDFIPAISVFDDVGRLQRTIGRLGSGPGEFRAAPKRIGRLDGLIWATDRFATHFFSADGIETEQVRFQIPLRTEGSILVPGTPLVDRSVLPGRLVTDASERFFTSDRLPLRRVARDGTVIDTLLFVDLPMARYAVVGAIDDRGGRVALKHPLAAWNGESWLPVAADPGGAFVVLLSGVRLDGSSGTFELLKVRVDGDTLLRRSIRHERRRIADDEEEFLRDRFAALVAGDFAGTRSRPMPPSESERRRARARELITFPEFYPPVRQIVVGTDGSIWLLRESSPRPADIWEIYGETGELEGTVQVDFAEPSRMPWNPRLEILRASRTEVWGTTTGDLDVPRIHRYSIELRGCQPPA